MGMGNDTIMLKPFSCEVGLLFLQLKTFHFKEDLPFMHLNQEQRTFSVRNQRVNNISGLGNSIVSLLTLPPPPPSF